MLTHSLALGYQELERVSGMPGGNSVPGSLELASDFVTYQPCDLGELLSFWSFSFLSCKQEIILNCLPFGKNRSL